MRGYFVTIAAVGLLSLLFLAPEWIAAARPRPGAVISIPVTGTATLPDGRRVTVSGSVSVDIENPVPPPPPPTPRIFRLESGGQPTISVPAGTLVRITGENLTGAQRLNWNGQPMTTLRWEAGAIEFQAPSVTTPITAPVDLFRQSGTAWAFALRGPPLTITPTIGPPPPPGGEEPVLFGIRGAGGETLLTAPPGTKIRVLGLGFGASGRLRWNTVEVKPDSWSEGMIEFTVPAGTPHPRGQTLTIIRSDGKYAMDRVLGGQ